MNEKHTDLKDSGVHSLIHRRNQLMSSLQNVEHELARCLADEAHKTFKPLSQQGVVEMVESNIGKLAVKELCLISGVAPATYYNILGKVHTVKIESLQSVLNTIGLELYIGQKPVPVLAVDAES